MLIFIGLALMKFDFSLLGIIVMLIGGRILMVAQDKIHKFLPK